MFAARADVIYSVDNTVNSILSRDFYFGNKGPTMDKVITKQYFSI